MKYELGDRVLHKITEGASLGSEHVGMITGITHEIRKGATTTSYELDNLVKVSDSDILGKIQFLKAPVARIRNRSKKVESKELATECGSVPT